MSSRAVPYRDLIARNLRAARAAASLSQEDLADRMAALGFAWYRPTVSVAERGTRRVTLEEALALMVALETSLEAIVYPPAEFQPVSLPGGQEVMLPAAKYTYDPGRQSVWDGSKPLL
jgi:transcriptional regulator with XRE-family HTH domain